MRQAVFLILLIAPFICFAQQPAKKVLTTDDFASWNTISNQSISNNGKIISYEINPQKGDGNLVFNMNNKNEVVVARGKGATIGPENNFIIYKIGQPQDTIRAAKKKKVKKDNMPMDSLGIFVFGKKEPVFFANLKSYKVPEENAAWVAFMLKPEKKENPNEKGKGVKEDKEKPLKKKTKQDGDNLVLFNIKNADTLLFHNVTEYNVAKKGGSIVFTTQLKNSTTTHSKIRYFNTVTGNTITFFESEGWVKKVVADEAGGQFAFLHSKDTIDEKVYKLLYGNTINNNPLVVAEKNMAGIPVGWAPSENGSLSFSEDGTKLYLGTALAPKPEPEDSLLDEEKPKLDIWHWEDLTLQPQQKVEASREKKRVYRAVYHVDKQKFIQLADLNINTIRTIQKGNADIALGADRKPYMREASWTGKRNSDYYLVDLNTGIKRLIVKNNGMVQLSPAGKYVVWYEPKDSSYYCQSTKLGDETLVSLTKILPVSFHNELNDMPMDPRPYGIAGWSEADKFVYIYDRYDIWKLDPSGVRVPVNVTHAFGRRNQTVLRYMKLDKDEEFISISKPVVLSAFDERTMSSGYFSSSFSAVKDPELLIMDNYMFSSLKKAKNADKLIWTKQNAEMFPDIRCSNTKFGHIKRLSDANPQQEDFNWLKVKMVEWVSFTGETLRGLLYVPENMNPMKKYPMVTYFYERNVHTLNRHIIPSPSRSTINKAFYASNGYCIFVPDITYKVGYPGQSAYNAIVSGVNYLINKYPFINKDKIGLQGQSWGGYQAAFLVTQTDMFAAAMGGAPVSNMTSAYGGIRWQTGMSRMFQYEHTQSRIGGTLWEKPLLYIENSPLFHTPKIETPLLMMHNDKDGAVPWYQGIELFVAMRRLNKPAWMLTYNNEPHNLKVSSWANRMDLSRRMFQFFNHYLKDKEMPEWMKRGVPAIDKGESLGY